MRELLFIHFLFAKSFHVSIISKFKSLGYSIIQNIGGGPKEVREYMVDILVLKPFLYLGESL